MPFVDNRESRSRRTCFQYYFFNFVNCFCVSKIASGYLETQSTNKMRLDSLYRTFQSKDVQLSTQKNNWKFTLKAWG